VGTCRHDAADAPLWPPPCVRLQIRDGMLVEAEAMLDAGLQPGSTPATTAIGYRQAMEYIQVRFGRPRLGHCGSTRMSAQNLTTAALSHVDYQCLAFATVAGLCMGSPQPTKSHRSVLWDQLVVRLKDLAALHPCWYDGRSRPL
jgi:hypothetical protein